ncbi:MAG: hypothetical protein H0U67_03800, partial [Gemmatimonadetes bacterium]|nr:hypothetical protein [Gemmatimonadota bacterium]
LYTELAPWAALVQRFGRCARYPDESGRVIWLDLDLGEKQPVDHWARPYDRAELTAARKKLEGLDDVGLESLRKIKEEIDSEPGGQQAEDLFGYDPRFVPRDKDLFDLFDTTPDLSGADVDVSRFIRDGEELDVQVFWREVSGKEPGKRLRPHRRELCPVPFHRFRDFVREELKQGRGIWRRRYATGRSRKDPWEPLHRSRVDQAVFPGQVFLLERACGGYHPELGWTGDPRHNAFDLPVPAEAETRKSTAADDEEHADDLSISEWQSVLHHTRDVCQELESILTHEELHERLTDSDLKVLRLAARWHDRGKAHLSFTAKIKAESLSHSEVQQRLEGQPPAKAPEHAWRRDPLRTQPLETPDKQRDRRRPGHRHELASALSILETLYLANPAHEAFAWPDGLSRTDFGGDSERPSPVVCPDEPFVKELNDLCRDEFDLLVYLVAAHHGKVRMSLRSSPDDDRDDVPDPVPADTRQARGVRDGDELPLCEIPAADLSAAGMVAPGVTLWLDPMELGLSPRYGASWRERMQLLLERLGPFRLAYLEALLRAADCRASMKNDERGTGEA